MYVYKPIRVLCVMSTLDRGGAESMVMSLFRNIDRNVVIFDFVKHSAQVGAFENEILEMGGKIYSAPRYRIYNHVAYIKWWEKFLKRHPEYQIIHGHFFTISSLYFSVAKKMGRITIGHSHCEEIKKEQITNIIKYALSEVLISNIEKYSDYCLACSLKAGEWVFKHKAFDVLNNAIDVSKFQLNNTVSRCVREELKMGNYFVIGNVGRFDVQKNPYGTLDIFKRIHDRVPESKLLWVGDGPMFSEIYNKAEEYGIKKDIVFTGIRNDVERLLQAMDVFVFPSYFEGLPVSLIEAQAAGLHCYISDQVTDEVDITGLCHFLPINDLDKWTTEIVKNLNKKEDTSEKIKKAGYDIKTTSQWLQNYYLQILNDHIS